jgi:hypothetical protein
MVDPKLYDTDAMKKIDTKPRSHSLRLAPFASQESWGLQRATTHRRGG